MFSLTKTIVILLFIGWCTPALSQKDKEALPLDPQVITGRLPNGFTYYIRKNVFPEKRALFYLVNKVGSVLETDQQRGLAHFIEHMSFNGTTHFPKSEMVNYLQNAGVRFGADLNAYTNFDETVYQLPISTENKKLFKNAFQIMFDWAQGATLDSLEIEKERGVVLAEKRQRLGFSKRVQDQTFPYILNFSKYADRVPIGTDEVLKNFKHDQIRAFYHDWYRPDLQALIVVGDINVNEVEEKIREMFSSLKNPAPENPKPINDIPLTNRNQFIVVTDVEASNIRLDMTIKHPAMRLRTIADFREYTSRGLLNQMMGDRFAEILQQENAAFLSARASMGKLIANLDAFSASVIMKPMDIEKGVKAFRAEIARAQKFGFMPNELKMAKAAFMAQVESADREKNKLSSDAYIREYVDHFLNGTASVGIPVETTIFRSVIEQISAAEICSLLNSYVSERNVDLILIANDSLRMSLPDSAKINGWLDEGVNMAVTPYKDRDNNRVVLMRKLPQAGKITAERLFSEIGAKEIVFANGVKVLLKPTDFKKDEILISGFSLGGLSVVNDADFYAARLAGDVASISGVADLSATDLKNLLNSKKVQVVPFINDLSQGINAVTSPDDLELTLQLLHLYLTKPRKDPVVFNRLIDNIKLSRANSANLPLPVFQDTIQTVMGDHHFRKMKMPERMIDDLDADKILEVYRERFENAGQLTFTIVGNFDAERIQSLLATYLGSLPATGRKDTIKDLHIKYPIGRISRKVVKGKDPKAIVVLNFCGDFNYTPDMAAQLNALSGILKMRLIEILREDQGGVYTANVNLSTNRLPAGQYNISVTFVCDPSNVEPLILSVNKEILRIKQEGPEESYIHKFVAGEKGQVGRFLKSNDFWKSYLNSKQLYHEELNRSPTLDERFNFSKLSKNTLKEVANTFLNSDNYVRFVLVPEQ